MGRIGAVGLVLMLAGCGAPAGQTPTEAQVRAVMAGQQAQTKETDPPFLNMRAEAAYKAGRHSEAARLYRLSAIQGTAGSGLAQAALGLMYAEGKGVPQDLVAAMAWSKPAAMQGYASAQIALGALYLHGPVRDPVQAHMWFDIAATRDYSKDAAALRDAVTPTLTAQQLAEARRQARAFRTITARESLPMIEGR